MVYDQNEIKIGAETHMKTTGLVPLQNTEHMIFHSCKISVIMVLGFIVFDYFKCQGM